MGGRRFDEALGSRSDGLYPWTTWIIFQKPVDGPAHADGEICRDSNGFRFVLRSAERAYRARHTQRDCDLPVLDAYRKILRPGDTVFDVGAHVGRYAVYPSRLVGPEGRVFAFEPIDETYWALKANIALNHCENIRPHRLALGAAPGTARMHLYGPAFSSWSSLTAHPMVEPGGETVLPSDVQEVPIDTIDAFATREGVDTLRLLKIDVEGHEIDVLRGARGLLEAGRINVICFEVSRATVKGSGNHPRAIQRLLEETGYSIQRYDRGRGVFSPVDEAWTTAEHDNLFASRADLGTLRSSPATGT